MTVILVTLDGVRPDAIQQATTLNLDRVIAEGAYTMAARSVMPTMTLPCHMSIVHSVPPERHGVITNEYRPMARPVPGLFEVVRNAGKRGAMVFNWGPLRDLTRPESLSYSYFEEMNFDDLPNTDHRTIDISVALLGQRRYDLIFVYIGAPDEIGHAHGWMSEAYIRQVEVADAQVGRLLAAMHPEDTILIEADHGGHDRNHGTDMPEDMLIPWMLYGHGVQPGEVSQPVTLLDTAPTLTSLLGIGQGKYWEGKPVTEALA